MAADLRTAICQELLFSTEITEAHIRRLRTEAEQRLCALSGVYPDIAVVLRLLLDVALAQNRLTEDRVRLASMESR